MRAALALADAGSRWRRIELTRIAYATLGLVAAKLLLEDLPLGHLEFIAASIFLFALTLIAVPRLARIEQKAIEPYEFRPRKASRRLLKTTHSTPHHSLMNSRGLPKQKLVRELFVTLAPPPPLRRVPQGGIQIRRENPMQQFEKRGDEAVAPSWAHLRIRPFPQVALQVLQLANNENVQLHQLSDLISSDPAFASEVLTIANSLLYAPRFPPTAFCRPLPYWAQTI